MVFYYFSLLVVALPFDGDIMDFNIHSEEEENDKKEEEDEDYHSSVEDKQ